MIEPPWIRVVIVTFDSGLHTQACLDALAVQTETGFEAVVVDNGSADGAIEQLILPDKRFTLRISDTNRGFSGGSNWGLSDAKTPYVMTINPDTRLSKDCLAELLKGTKKFPESEMLSPLLFQSEEMLYLDGAGDCLSIFGLCWRNGADKLFTNYEEYFIQPSEVFSPTGAAALYRRDSFEKAGGFDPRFFCYLEDIDLGLRIRARGGVCMLIPTARGVHTGGHSSDQFPGFALERSVTNNLNLIIKSAPLLLLPLMLACHLCAHFRFQFKNKDTIQAAIRTRGFRTALLNIPQSCKERLRRRPYPLQANLRIAKAISWSIAEVKERSLRTTKYYP